MTSRDRGEDVDLVAGQVHICGDPARAGGGLPAGGGGQPGDGRYPGIRPGQGGGHLDGDAVLGDRQAQPADPGAFDEHGRGAQCVCLGGQRPGRDHGARS
ncbi:MAG TPA: hypothetical protein VFQ68_15980 [Streptosporangiaceae bacterium]|nr:hypothetical protein [Streptosporangiaceae bacterium]